MTTTLSGELKSFRSMLADRRYCSFFLRTFALANLRSKVNTWIALAEELEDELRLAERRGDRALAVGNEATIIRFPRRIVIVSRPDDGGDAA